ncbi:MAG TPA: tetratricopeptide repeat protein [Mobilitalea sp.]|nr:tetratricopeptide repeat protein [Mobilitalea sp.]
MKGFLSFGLLLIMICALTGCSSAGSYYKSGKDYFVSGNYAEAEKSFSSAIKKNPNRADYYIDYGMSLIAVGKYTTAIKQFDRAYLDKDIRMIKANNKRALRGKGIAYFSMMKYKKAIKQFDLALSISELSKLDMDILYYKGSSLMAIGENENAEKVYDKILSMDSDNTEALYDRASVYRNMGDYAKSLADYDEAITLSPNNYNYYFGKYNLLIENGKNKEASDVLKKAAAIKVKTNEDKYNLAKIHYFQGRYDAALSELSEGFANGFSEAYYYIGEVYRMKKDYKSAVYYYEKYIEEDKSPSPAVYNQAGACLIKLEDYTKALQYLEKGIEYQQTGSLQSLMKNEIIAYENLGSFDKAYESLIKYLDLNPEDKDAQGELDFVKTRMPKIKEDSNK